MKSSGTYYKVKTKTWFIDKGYESDYLEKLQRIYIKNKQGQERILFVKKDVLASDGFASNETEFILWNSKFNKANIAKGIKEFNQHKIPKFIKKWLVVWEKRAREPEIIEVE